METERREGRREGWKEGWGGGNPLPGLVEGRERGEAAPEEGRRRRGREGNVVKQFLTVRGSWDPDLSS